MKTFFLLLLLFSSIALAAQKTPIEMQCRSPQNKPGVPPGRVACVLDNNCATCHSAVARDFGRLDLSRWLTSKSNGAIYTFPHQNSAGEQLTRRETFERLLRRITSTDRDFVMPPGGGLKEAEKQELVSWITETLKHERP